MVALGRLMALCFLFINFATFVKFLPMGSIVEDIEKLFIAPFFDTGLVVYAADTNISYNSLGLNKSKYFCCKWDGSLLNWSVLEPGIDETGLLE